ncbi:hypothetical protein [Paractinoplanes atraurantiacus]|uniref:Uncharacterized protein n=1 Tax=Paractinoplanes atraurantiacus TaxID=1036182 RepID=A0A285IV53_9ACTN|nr:hypothetical protein [Actinoplanes atraurantiacus]SNY51567.1 hypothetical protein SAMN05421748_11215 [Actinoplanes atraurantiacus]
MPEPFQVVSTYSAHGDARGRGGLAILIPDMTPDGLHPADARVETTEGELPWPALISLLDRVGSESDLWPAAPPPGGGRLEVRIPDRKPRLAPFRPEPLDKATLHIHGAPALPWLVFQHFVTAVLSAGERA